MTHWRYDTASGCMVPCQPPRAPWWRRWFSRPKPKRRALTRGQAAQLVAFRGSETGAERL